MVELYRALMLEGVLMWKTGSSLLLLKKKEKITFPVSV